MKRMPRGLNPVFFTIYIAEMKLLKNHIDRLKKIYIRIDRFV